MSPRGSRAWADCWGRRIAGRAYGEGRGRIQSCAPQVARSRADTYEFPTGRPHARDSITIVGYNNTACPSTYTYVDTCGLNCDSGGGNSNSQAHVITQTAMGKAIEDRSASGVAWYWMRLPRPRLIGACSPEYNRLSLARWVAVDLG